VNVFAAVKRFTGMVFRRNPFRIFTLARSTVDWLKEVGDGTSSSTVMAPLLWICRTFPEAPPGLWELLDNGQEEQVRDHPLLRLLQRPNLHYTGPILWMATLMDWSVDGNAYWLKIRDQDGIVRELWWVPHWLIEPVSNPDDPSVFVWYYAYSPGDSEPLRIDPNDVVHFRFGLDSDDTRKGYSPLKSVLREVFTDDEAAAFTASLLRNMGVPGLVVSPKDASQILSEQDAKDAKRYVKEAFGGDRRGEPLVMTGATEIAQFGFSPEQLVLKDIRRIPEERVSAVTGVPAVVAGLGAGLDRSTFTNFAEARVAAVEQGIIPAQRIMGEDIRFQLLPDFEADPFLWRFGFDLSKVKALQEDAYRQAQRYDLGFRGSWIMRAEARRANGLEVDEGRDNVFLVPINVAVVPADGGAPMVLSQNGNQTPPPKNPVALALSEVADAMRVQQPADPELLAVLSAFVNKPEPVSVVNEQILELLREALAQDPATTDPELIERLEALAERPINVHVEPPDTRPRSARASRTADGDLVVTYEEASNGKVLVHG
jgi:HK97 family phage portal protein